MSIMATVTFHWAAPVVPIHNCGASGYSCLPKRDRTAHMSSFRWVQTRGRERYAFNGHAFELEPGSVCNEAVTLSQSSNQCSRRIPHQSPRCFQTLEMHWFACGSGTPVVLLPAFQAVRLRSAGSNAFTRKKYRVILPHLGGMGLRARIP